MVENNAVPPVGQPALRVTAMPADTNPYGDIFGGWIMSQMDMAAGLVAARHSKGRAVTIAVDAMQFYAPVAVGDEVSVYTDLVKVGRTSMTIEVEAWRRDRFGEAVDRVTQARFVFVAIDEDRKPRVIAA
ncbi:acyl-CoA thioesterase [Sphingomonas sp. Leaf67]|uniref:acyl-CoA thioesterase n=1 Tax=Sphingomonas sp. Leaf67 TaxID=1736230 RepID=UPI0006FD314A|nr:acyl-CoA thioesterase [Sphingomonas sp. Leaf67]KQN91713.1 acyl-CoA thioesterase [Sphingomonas sp. Leaf67]